MATDINEIKNIEEKKDMLSDIHNIDQQYILSQKLQPNKVMGDKFWTEDISILYNNDRLTEFYPSYDMTLVEKLNSIVRLSIYLSIILYLFTASLTAFSHSLGFDNSAIE